MAWLKSILTHLQNYQPASHTNNLEENQLLALGGQPHTQPPLFTPPFVKDVPTGEQASIALKHLSNRISTGHPTLPLQSVAPTNNQSEIQTKPSYVKVFPLPLEYAPPHGSNTGREATRWNLTLAVVTDALQENGIHATRAEVEEMARQIEEEHGLRFSNKKPPQAQFCELPNGQRVWGYELRLDPSFQKEMIQRYQRLSPEIKGKVGLTEMDMQARMRAAIEMSYDKHLTPEVKQVLGNISKEQVAGVMLVSGAVGIVSRTAGKGALGPLGVGAALYGGIKSWQSAQQFIDLCGQAKTQADLDRAAQQFAKFAGEMAADGALGVIGAGAGKFAPHVTKKADQVLTQSYKGLQEAAERLRMPDSILVPEPATPDGFTIPVPGKAQADELNIKSKSEELAMLKGGSKAGQEQITETAQEGLSEIAQSGAKRVKQELGKEGLKRAQEQLGTLNVARTELLARMDTLTNNSKFSPPVQIGAKKAYNSLLNNLKDSDLSGALRDVHGKPVRISGSGEAWDHLQEVQQGVRSLSNARDTLIREMRRLTPGSDEYNELSNESDALFEMISRIERFLEIK